jgi:DNA-binding LacI/PurR family transcriptional regulator
MKPLYQVIIENLTESIESGFYKANGKLPSEAELMKSFATSRITVTRALKELEIRGIIYRRKGKGSFAAPRRSTGSRIISLVLPHKEGFFSGGQQYVRSITAACREKGYLCSVHYSEQSSKKERAILEELRRHEVSGVILYPIGSRNIDEISRLSLDGFPILLLDRSLDELDLPVVSSENLEGARNAVSHILDKGHERVAFVGVLDAESAALRYRGYCRALTEAGLPIEPQLIHTRFTGVEDDNQAVLSSGGADAILEKIDENGVTACFCVNDLCAFRIADAAKRAGIDVPRGLSIVGFDHMSYLSELGLNLTTVAQDYEKLGRESVDLLIHLVDNPDISGDEIHSHIIVPTRFVEGGTVVAPFFSDDL